MKCHDCFFQSGRSFLEPLDENLPNMATLEQVGHRVVRVNDGNDSNNNQDLVIVATKHYPLRFYNTSIPNNLEKFEEPVVLTVNPGKMTDTKWHVVQNSKNLMFVRIRVNAWNLETIVDPAVKYYTKNNIPVILTFMAYSDTIDDVPEPYKSNDYILRKRTTNSYLAITTKAWRNIMARYEDNYYEAYFAVDPEVIDKTIPDEPNGIPGYNLIYIFGILSILVAILIRKKIKK